MGTLALVAFVIGLPTQDGLAKYGLKPNSLVTAVDGKATLGEGETIELIAMTDLAQPGWPVYGVNLAPVPKLVEDEFWSTLDDRLPPPPEAPERVRDQRSSQTYVRETFSQDDVEKPEEKRTFAMVFRLSPNLHRALDVDADSGKTYMPRLARTRFPKPEDATKSVGEGRILRPVFAKDNAAKTFDFRLQVPGGPWTNLAEFAFIGETTLLDGEVKATMRYQDNAEFRTVDGVRKIVEYKSYYLIFTLPEALREMELEVVTNDPSTDAALLPPIVTQHIRGETYAPEFTGKDLFLVYGLRSRGAERKFTLRARPKRTVVFKNIPYRRS